MGHIHAHNPWDLSEKVETAAHTPGPRQVLTFTCAGERFAIDIQSVRQITPASGLTRVPGSRPEVAGIANLRGAIVPVLNLGGMLGMTDTRPDDQARLIVLEQNGRRTALLVDRVHEVLKIDPRTLAPAAHDAPPADTGLIGGVVTTGPESLGMLDTDRLFETLDHAENGHTADAA